MKSSIVILILILLTSCSRPCSPWQRQELKQSLATTYSTRIYYTPTCPYSELGLSFIFDPCGRRTYLYLLCGTFDNSISKQRIEFVYAIDNTRFESKAIVMKGGQVAELDAQSSEAIFTALLQGKHVAIATGPYLVVIAPCDFKQLYEDRFGLKNCVPQMIYKMMPISS